MDSICRLCLHKNDTVDMKNIFEFSPKYFEINLTEILYWIFEVEVIVEDSYSKLICYKCLNVIESIGKFRKFFQVNQTFLHERKCPNDYEVMSGWYNTRDIGTNTDFINSETLVQQNVNTAFEEYNTSNRSSNEINKNQKQTKSVKEVEWVNVPYTILKDFGKQNSVNSENKIHRIEVPIHLFNYYKPQVTLPDLKKVSSNEGYAKMGKTYYKIRKPIIELKKIDCDKNLLKNYNKTDEFTYKKYPAVSKIKHSKKKRKFIYDNYYGKPKSSFKEASEARPPKASPQLSIRSLVKTNEIHVHVCKYCSKVFKYKLRLQNHYLAAHQQKIQNKFKLLSRNLHPIGLDVLDISRGMNKSDRAQICTSSASKSKETSLNHVEKINELEILSKLETANEICINNLNKEITNHKANETVNNGLSREDNIIISLTERSQTSSGAEIPETQNSSDMSSVTETKKFKKSNGEIEHNSGQYHMDYLKTVIFGKYSESNPKISYYSEKLQDHNYANVQTKADEVSGHAIIKASSSKKKMKMDSNVANVIKERFTDIKKTRDQLDILKKIRFALYNEIENNNIKADLQALKQKLSITENT